MKYWNKNKYIRQKFWTKVTRPHYANNTTYDELKLWCQQQPSIGRFYAYYGASSWWFEDPKDAVHFALQWSV